MQHNSQYVRLVRSSVCRIMLFPTAVLTSLECYYRRIVGYGGIYRDLKPKKASRIWFAQKTVECGFAPK